MRRYFKFVSVLFCDKVASVLSAVFIDVAKVLKKIIILLNFTFESIFCALSASEGSDIETSFL